MSLRGARRQLDRICVTFRRQQLENWDELLKVATEEELMRLLELMNRTVEGFPASQEFTIWNWADCLPEKERDEARALLTTLETRRTTHADAAQTPWMSQQNHRTLASD